MIGKRIAIACVGLLCLSACATAETVDTPTTSPVSTMLASATAPLTQASTPSPTATPAPFGLNPDSLPMQQDEILYRVNDELHIVGLDGSNDRLLLQDANVHIGLPHTSPSGRYLTLSAMQPFVLDLQTGEVTPLSSVIDSAIASFFWVPGDILYYIWKAENLNWRMWRVAMPDVSVQEPVYGVGEGGNVIQVLDDTYLIVIEALVGTERQSTLLDWRTGTRTPLAEPGYQLSSVSQSGNTAVVYGPDDGLEGGWLAGFYLADFSIERGAENLRRFTPTTGIAYAYHPRLSPDGKQVLAERLLSGDSLLADLVLIAPDETGAYRETPITPLDGWLCRGGLWSGSETVVASCHPRDAELENASLWRIPLNGEPSVQLAKSGSLIR
jgi:hypothetical protein